MKILKPGDPCPCCGQPIKTDDPYVLMLLSYLAYRGQGAQESRPETGAAGQECPP